MMNMNAIRKLLPENTTMRKGLATFTALGLGVTTVFALTGEPIAAAAMGLFVLLGAQWGTVGYRLGRVDGRVAANQEWFAQLDQTVERARAEFDREVRDGEATRP